MADFENGQAPGGRTAVQHPADGRFEQGLRAFFAYRDLGVAGATGGTMGANVIRAVAGTSASEAMRPDWHVHELAFQMVFVLRGWVEFEYEDVGFVRLETGSSVVQPPLVRHREIRHSTDVEMLEITSPAEFVTRVVA